MSRVTVRWPDENETTHEALEVRDGNGAQAWVFGQLAHIAMPAPAPPERSGARKRKKRKTRKGWAA